jgi:Kef-type K+ transport system membrane component KefB
MVLAACVWDGVAGAANEASPGEHPVAGFDIQAMEEFEQEQAARAAAGEQPHDEEGHAGHKSPLAPVLMGVLIILLMAKLAGDLFERFGMPAVLGELCVGIILGNVWLLGWDGLDFLKAPAEVDVKAELDRFEAEVEAAEEDPAAHREQIRTLRESLLKLDPYNTGAIIKMLAGIGVVLLLFEVGLESNVRDMLSVGASSMLVAVLGVVAPMILGYGAGLWLLPERGWQVHLFIGATLCATSVGITARVLKDLGRSQQRESRIVLGAAVIDDVLGLIVLAIVSGVIQQGEDFDPVSLVGIVLKAIGFLFGAIILGTRLFARPLFRAASVLRGHGLLVVTALVICFGFGWLASVVGLDPIVGAFAAGLILERAHYQELKHREDVELEEALRPLTAVLVPIFFVQMGIMVDLSSFANPSVWGLAAALTVVAIIGKQVCALGVLERGLNRLAVGLGMIPRGEVGLIFASIGMSLKTPAGESVVLPSTYSAIVVMVILTTMITPPLLKWGMGRKENGDSTAGEIPTS